MATPEIALLTLIIAGFSLAPGEAPAPAANAGSATSIEATATPHRAVTADPVGATDPGKWIASDSFTAPPELARCIAYNINRKMPHLSVRQRADATTDNRILLVLSAPGNETIGVIRVEPDDSGSKLTTWLAARDQVAAPDIMARRLVAGC